MTTMSGPWWRLDRDGRLEGPFAAAEMRGALAAGRLRPSDPVWSPDAEDWGPFDLLFPDDPEGGPRPPWTAFLVSLAVFAVTGSAVVVSLFSPRIWESVEPPSLPVLHLIYAGLAVAMAAATAAVGRFGRSTARRLRRRPRAHRILHKASGGLTGLGLVLTIVQGIGTGIAPRDIADTAGYRFSVGYAFAPDRIVIDGDIGFGFARTVLEALDGFPDPVRIEITSGGGLAAEALRVAAAVEKRPGATVVARRTCESACTLVLMAGSRRLADRDMVLGFHALSIVEAEERRGSLFGFNLSVAIARHFGDDYLIRRGVPADVIAEANRRGHEGLYEVDAATMLARGALTGLVDPLPEADVPTDSAGTD